MADSRNNAPVSFIQVYGSQWYQTDIGRTTPVSQGGPPDRHNDKRKGQRDSNELVQQENGFLSTSLPVPPGHAQDDQCNIERVVESDLVRQLIEQSFRIPCRSTQAHPVAVKPP